MHGAGFSGFKACERVPAQSLKDDIRRILASICRRDRLRRKISCALSRSHCKESLMVLPDFQHFGDLIGALAAALTTTAFIPQAWHTWKTKHASGISLGMYSIFTTGVALWLAYGLIIGAWPVVIANGITFVLALFILAMKLRYG
jgi:MtN3 and saliva related transmembrane protein